MEMVDRSLDGGYVLKGDDASLMLLRVGVKGAIRVGLSLALRSSVRHSVW